MKRISILLFVFALYSCSSNEEIPQRVNGYEPVLKDKMDTLEHDVLDGHDQAMGRFSKLSKSARKIQVMIDSLSAISSEKYDINYFRSLESAKKELDRAQQTMNEWMDGFKLDSLKENKDARTKYLESELIKVNTMKQKLFDALSKSDSILNIK